MPVDLKAGVAIAGPRPCDTDSSVRLTPDHGLKTIRRDTMKHSGMIRRGGLMAKRRSFRARRISGLTLRLPLLAGVVVGTLVLPEAFGQLPPVPGAGDRTAEPEPKLVVAERIFDLGALIEGDKAVATWRIENHGDADLVVEQLKAGCGCTAVKLHDDDRTIKPGGQLDLDAEFDSRGRRGSQRKNISVYTNDPSEPKLKLELTAQVSALYDITPMRALSLRMLRRGETGAKAIEIRPVTGRKVLDILSVDIPPGVPLTVRVEDTEAPRADGKRLLFTIGEDAPLGTLDTLVQLVITVDGVQRNQEVRVRGEVVADLIWLPKLVDVTRVVSARGNKLAPVTIKSTDTATFEVNDASAGPLLDVEFKPIKTASPNTGYQFIMKIREDAPAGPFATYLEVSTSSFDQPLIRVPVFGHVAPLVSIEPPVILLVKNGTQVGVQRRLKLQTSTQTHLGITGITCSIGAVTAELDHAANDRYQHLRFFDVRLTGDLPAGAHEAVLTVSTNVAGAERIDVPVRIDVPK